MSEPRMVDPHALVMTGENSSIPARGAQLAVNGEAAGAKLFMQDRFGKPASNCVPAWSETWTGPAA